jgi:FlaA1/EpsC-like NDP-sugar epimerase
MRARIKHFLDRIFLPRWIVLATDLFLVALVFLLTYFLRINLIRVSVNVPQLIIQLAASLPFFLMASYLTKSHHSMLRTTNLADTVRVLVTMVLYTGGLFLIYLVGMLFIPVLKLPLSVVVIQFFVSVVALIGYRMVLIYLWNNLVRKPKPEMSMMIWGAGSMGQITRLVIEKDDNLHYKLVGFIDDNPSLQGKTVKGLTIYSPKEAFARVVDQKMVKEIVIGITPEKISKERKEEIVDMCIARGIRIKEVPSSKEWLDGNFYASQIHDVNIEDLLGRPPILIEDSGLTQWIHGAKVMVTGAAGSIGSEIVRQVAALHPGCICLVDQAESPLYDLHNEVASRYPEVSLHSKVGSVNNALRMRRIFDECVPDVIFHASAYKHVPFMEQFPYEALRTNVLGTKTIADLAVQYGVKKFVMVSTDKAVNPTNVMGATKRICEMYTRSLHNYDHVETRFITTRFGNVLGSNGSVIPLFRRQIAQGGPVTVTDREIIRYFMTIPEACRLVLEAGHMGEGGEIFLFDMGKPVKIWDLAEKMIRLSGFVPHKDIKIIETGLRPGEKLFEELLAKREEHLPTHHEKILIATIKPYDFGKALEQINDLVAHIESESEMQLVARMKAIVPEFKSQNSRFERLDAIEPYPKAASATPGHKAPEASSGTNHDPVNGKDASTPSNGNGNGSSASSNGKGNDNSSSASSNGNGRPKEAPVPAKEESFQDETSSSVDIDSPHF